MKNASITIALMLLLSAVWLAAAEGGTKWAGVDETVVEKFATAGGRPPREPFINTDQGDLLLFVFLIAGTVGGFIGGYYYRELFPPKPKAQEPRSNV
jgi:ABC-type cobalt transport system substrate-binding protein